MLSTYDLHSHSSASDGLLSPTELVAEASSRGVTTLALTDHDSAQGVEEAGRAAVQAGIRLIPGIELSVTWERRCFHVLGLNIDPEYPPLAKGVRRLQEKRQSRAEEIGEQLKRHGIHGALEAVKKMAGDGMMTRTHFARYLVNEGRAENVRDVFKHYLVRGKPGFVATNWADLNDAIDWIEGSGGVSVLAHPLRYKLTGAWMRRFLEAFKQAGGRGMEVVCGNSTEESVQLAGNYARNFDLLGSAGSDFHSPENPWITLGKLLPFPKNVKPVWSLWNS